MQTLTIGKSNVTIGEMNQIDSYYKVTGKVPNEYMNGSYIERLMWQMKNNQGIIIDCPKG